MITKGTTIKAQEALDNGLVDDVVVQGDLLSSALSFLREKVMRNGGGGGGGGMVCVGEGGAVARIASNHCGDQLS